MHKNCGYCDGCFTGKYPAPTTEKMLEGKERGGLEIKAHK